MTESIIEDPLHRAIDCPTCRDEPTQLQAWATEDGLDRMEVDSIQFLTDDDVRELATYGEGGIEGHCLVCNGPDDGDDGNQEE